MLMRGCIRLVLPSWGTGLMKAKRRQFGRGYAPNPPSGRYSHQHKELAKVVTMNAGMRDTTTWENHTPTRPRCMTPRCPYPRVAGRSRCGRCGPATTKQAGDRTHYDYGHQQRRARRIAAGEQCAMAYLGGCHGPLHLDHIVPISLGGQSGDEHEQLLCERHNIGKGGRNRIRS